MLSKLLIANRGEIALRVIRACQELGVATVAVYTAPDQESRYVRMADQAFQLETTYLDIPALLEIAQRAGCDAVHPGYGFLAESPDFARACQAAGLTWVGPNPEAIALMGSKTVSRRVAKEAGVPIVPGTTEPVTDPAAVRAFGDSHGWPVAIKAAAGGGGRGLVLANSPDEAEAALAKAIREGESYFGNGEVYMERYLGRPRHIEVQILADRHGKVIHLGERECSIQRRHQKLVEEAPSMALTPELRRAMGDTAVRMAEAVGYDSAGTCEFLFQDGEFYFLEMNTRIQVEHTVTELVYGVDLVKEQIRIAAGGHVPERLLGLEPFGWALECRINAEDPAQNFRPAPGLITRYVPPEGPGVRVDAAVYAGWKVPEMYDSLLAKLITWGADREEAIARMQRALNELEIEGVPTTIPLFKQILAHPKFRSGDLSTHFIGQDLTREQLATLAPAAPSAPPSEEGPRFSPAREFRVEVNRQLFTVSVSEKGGSAVATVAAAAKPKRPRPGSAAAGAASGTLTAPMHAMVQRVLVEVGQAVEAGTPLLVLEAMKMETEVLAPMAGVVQTLGCQAGQTVEGGAVLAVIA
jgi:acetyl-CoA/propionyl-CoA carboxylase biotin carboxyl carrier protein